ncbi:MAG TPA: hypothetical protein VGL54_07310 [Solirubrobacteraceae bacterium]|jgi:hypothetical protein
MNARRLISATLTTLGVIAGVLLFAGAPALAALTHPFTGKSFGPEGISAGGPLGAFSEPQSIAVEQGTGDVFVYDVGEGGRVYKFSAAGDPVDFSSTSTNVIEGLGGGAEESQIAVDNSSGPDKGDIYVDTGQEVLIYDGSTGAKLATFITGEVTGEEEPCGVAVDPSGAVYVSFFEEIKKYTPVTNPVTTADYVSSLPEVPGVCNIAADSTGDIYAAGYGGGTVTEYEASQFNTLEVPAIGTAIDAEGATLAVDPFPGGDVYIDELHGVAQYDSSGSRLGTFGEVGPGALSEEEESYGVAVDHASGQVYVDGEGESAGDPDGERVVEIFGPGVVVPDVSIEAESELTPTSVTLNGTVNPDGAGSATCQIEYGSSESEAYGQTAACSESVPSGSSPVAVSAEVSGLSPSTSYHYRLSATNTNGTNYSEEGTFTTFAASPPAPPVIKSESSEHIGPTGATITARIAPEALETHYHFEYGTSVSYGASTPIPDGKLSSDFGEPEVSTSLTGLSPSTTYHFRVVASNADSPTPIFGADQTFTTLPAALIDSESALNVTDESATLQTQINPQGNDTHAYFQYGTTSCSAGPSACTELPSPPGFDVGSGESDQSESVYLQGLAPSTVYYYRVVASNALGIAYGAEHTFTTQGEGREGFVLPDGRAYEMVSPPSKHGALINSITQQLGTIQASEKGDAIAYSAKGPIVADPPGNQLFNTEVLSVRGPEGWSSRDIAPSNETVTGAIVGRPNAYKLFSPDLSLGLVEPLGGTSLSPEASEQTAYLRVNGACEATPEKCYLPLVTAANVPLGTKFGEGSGGGIEFEGASPDLSHVVLESPVPLTKTMPVATKGGLYEWAAGQLQLVSVLPKSAGGAPAPEPVLGGLSREDSRYAVSGDGSRIVWSENEGESRHLYMRDTTTQETVQLDAPAPGAPENHGEKHAPVFQTASSDGSKVFFTDAERLTASSTASGELFPHEADLYECEMVEGPGGLACDLRDLTVDEHAGEHADVQGLIPGVSEDGYFVYFVANGVLASGAAPGTCKGEVSGSDETCNLYVRHEGATTFIAALSGEDANDWKGDLANLTARVSPDGRYLAFMSDRSLTGYDNVDVNSGAADEEVFLYDAGSGRLVCASCNPSGERPVGVSHPAGALLLLVDEPEIWGHRWLAGSIPGWTSYAVGQAVYQSRYLSDSGRLFFDSADALVPQDVNGKEDVYEYEPPGLGSCEASSATFSAASDGCVGLISSGNSDVESAFLDASASGDDVFFLTAAQLVSQDYDTAFDVYDAHVCSQGSPCVASPPVPPPACDTADSCKAAPSPQPEVFGPTGSATFAGAGNLASAVAKPPVRAKSKVKALTRAQKLTNALRACKGKHRKKRRRASCEAQARKRYGARAKEKSPRQAVRSPEVHVKRNGR